MAKRDCFTETIACRVTQRDLKLLKRAARKSKTYLSDYMRAVIVGHVQLVEEERLKQKIVKPPTHQTPQGVLQGQ